MALYTIIIVIHSTKSGIPIGTVVVKIDSLVVDDQLSDEAIVTLLQEPNWIMEFAMHCLLKTLSITMLNYMLNNTIHLLNSIYSEYVQYSMDLFI